MGTGGTGGTKQLPHPIGSQGLSSPMVQLISPQSLSVRPSLRICCIMRPYSGSTAVLLPKQLLDARQPAPQLDAVSRELSHAK
jgi:hypothetical protein